MSESKRSPQPTILYHDLNLLVVGKPAGLLCTPDGYDPTKPHLQSVLEPEFGRLWIVHRLDKDTSGVVVLARNAEEHRALNLQFSNHQVSKTYHTIVWENPPWETITVDLPLRVNVGRRKRTAADDQRGKPAITGFRVLERFQGYTLIEAKPKTGRTHQIRAHLYSQNLSILADPLYGEKKATTLIDRLALHAKSLTIQHPATGKQVPFEAPYPNDFVIVLKKLHE